MTVRYYVRQPMLDGAVPDATLPLNKQQIVVEFTGWRCSECRQLKWDLPDSDPHAPLHYPFCKEERKT